MEKPVAEMFAAPPSHVPAHLVMDYDPQLEADYAEKGWETYARASQMLPPIIWSTAFGGGWMPMRAAIIREVFRNWKLFSSRNASQSQFARRLIPIDVDPPQHSVYRDILSHGFTPEAVAEMKDWVSGIAREIVNGIASQGHCDFGEDIADIMPNIIFTKLAGLPQEDARKLNLWARRILSMFEPPEERSRLEQEAIAYLTAVIDQRRRNPKNDMISKIIAAEHNGAKLSEDETLDFCYLLFIGGLDTMTNAMAHVFYLLAQRPDKQAEILTCIDDDGKLANEAEELLRMAPIIRTTRTVTRDVEFHGIQMRAGDHVILHTGIANFDAAENPNPCEPQFNRRQQHLTFGVGRHYCMGAHLARLETIALLREWFKRIPSFRLQPGSVQRYIPGMVAISNVKLEWDKTQAFL